MESWEKDRFKHTLELSKEYRIHGAVLIQQQFCDFLECDMLNLRRFFKKNAIPTYFLEFEVTVSVGQSRIRIEAFIEQIHAEDDRSLRNRDLGAQRSERLTVF